MKKKCFYITFMLITIISITMFVYSKTLVFSWTNPYTNTASIPYIAKTIGNLAQALNNAQYASKTEGCEYRYLFWNAYGSGFLKHNPIPNDLDFSIGIDLGEYDYDGNNADEIAKTLVNKIQSFQHNFNFYITTHPQLQIWSTIGPLDYLSTIKFDKHGYENSIAKHLDKALFGQEYIHYAKKAIQGLPIKTSDDIIEIPYLMRHHEILLEEYLPMLMFSDSVCYNDSMSHYMREISIIPEFYMTINHDNKQTRIELVPESYLGARLQLSRRAFASNVFIGNFSIDYQKNLEYMHNDNEFLFYRMHTFRRHLQEVENIVYLRNKPTKLFKRIMQIADSVYPLIEKDKYEEIARWVENNLSKPEIQTMNEYETICRNILSIINSMELFETLYSNNTIQVMYDKLGEVLKIMEDNNYYNKETLKALRDYYNNDITMVMNYKRYKDFPLQRKEVIKANFQEITMKMDEARYNKIENPEKIQEYIDLFNSIYTKSGYHRVALYWLDKSTVGIVKDDFTSKIQDLHKFALDNELADFKYKLIEKSEVPFNLLRYEVWTRYNPSQPEEQCYKENNKKLLEDKRNFNVKKKIVFSF